MKLKQWVKTWLKEDAGRTQSACARELKLKSVQHLNKLLAGSIPGPETMKHIEKATGGQVQIADFY